ncbi:MAG: hypothetical protein WA417_22305 [Stellaceae bacterium]
MIEVFVYPEYWAMHLMWASIRLFLLTKGPGVFSLPFTRQRRLGDIAGFWRTGEVQGLAERQEK